MKASMEHKITQRRIIDNFSNSKKSIRCIQRAGFVIINVNIAGSGHQYINDNPRIVRPQHRKLEYGGSWGTRIDHGNDIHDIYIAGPQYGDGKYDIGANRISKIVKTVIGNINNIIKSNHYSDTDSFQICFVGHSRGAVAVSLIIEEINKKRANGNDSDWEKVNILSSMQYDPVPGQTLGVSSKERFIHSPDVSPYYRTNLKRKVQNSIVVYSLYTQYGKEKFGKLGFINRLKNSFVPQAVYGTDIIILEYANHSVNINKGKQFSDYQLARGVYIKKDRALERINNRDEYFRKINDEIKLFRLNSAASKAISYEQLMEFYEFQQKRYNIIDNVVCRWFHDHRND